MKSFACKYTDSFRKSSLFCSIEMLGGPNLIRTSNKLLNDSDGSHKLLKTSLYSI